MEPKAKQSSESVVREIKRHTRRKFNSEEKIRRILNEYCFCRNSELPQAKGMPR